MWGRPHRDIEHILKPLEHFDLRARHFVLTALCESTGIALLSFFSNSRTSPRLLANGVLVNELDPTYKPTNRATGLEYHLSADTSPEVLAERAHKAAVVRTRNAGLDPTETKLSLTDWLHLIDPTAAAAVHQRVS